MDLTLAPFRHLNSQKKLVDEHQVPSGKQCGCLCPSCHAPLIASNGKQKLWHFALDSKSTLFTALEIPSILTSNNLNQAANTSAELDSSEHASHTQSLHQPSSLSQRCLHALPDDKMIRHPDSNQR